MYADIRRVPLGGASNDSGVVDDGNFGDWVATSSETLEIRPAILLGEIGDMLPLVGQKFLIVKLMT